MMAREKIGLADGQIDVMVKMAEGNPGAINVIMQVLDHVGEFGLLELLNMDDMDMRGCAIWIGYKDVCNCDIAEFVKRTHDRDPVLIDLVNEELPLDMPRLVPSGASFNR